MRFLLRLKQTVAIALAFASIALFTAKLPEVAPWMFWAMRLQCLLLLIMLLHSMRVVPLPSGTSVRLRPTIRFDSPINAKFLFYLFLDAKNCDALVGDLEERYGLIHKKFGVRRANFWYWTQALSSVLPIVWAFGKKIVLKPFVLAITWAIGKYLLKDGSWVDTIAETYRKGRS